MFLKVKSKTFDLRSRTHIMGILNITPDSFSDGGNFVSIDHAVHQAMEMEMHGVDIIDIGGESTRPNHNPVSVSEEIKRVIPVIEAIRKQVSTPISIDTYKAETAKLAIEAGADIINDIWGAKKDPNIALIAAEYNVPIILMHNRRDNHYESIIEDMIHDLGESVQIAKDAGVPDANIILDPGIGFAKFGSENLVVMNQFECFTQLNYPLLLGASRKSFINDVLPLPAGERDNATGATTCFGIMKGANIIRVHDVKRNVELARMTDAMLKGANFRG